ncbi:MAG: ATP-binding protein [Emcibacteraceae bacterium]|nr:ATP-binding protein [Emcibacteraceae bacterium]
MSQDTSPLFVKIIENMTDPFLLLDAEKHVVMANKSANKLFGDNLISHKVSDFLDNSNALNAINRALETGKSDTIEYATPSPRKRNFLLRIHILDEQDKTGELQRTLFLGIYDITSIREAERMRVDFVANVSHELRTPLASILGFVETLQGPAKNDKEAATRFLNIMQDEANRMTRLIEDLLSLSQIEREAHIPPNETVSLSQIINNVCDVLNLRINKRKLTVSITNKTEIDIITGDRDQLTQVFQNLIDNAIKYGEESTSIDIKIDRSVTPKGDRIYAKINVTNKGAGISTEHLERLTERFYRVDTARSRSLGGTGLGLAIVKHIIQRHEGHLYFQSELGKSTTVSVLLPLD